MILRVPYVAIKVRLMGSLRFLLAHVSTNLTIDRRGKFRQDLQSAQPVGRNVFYSLFKALTYIFDRNFIVDNQYSISTAWYTTGR